MRKEVIRSTDSPAELSKIDEAAAILRAGGLVVFPTETVYGIGANAAHPSAVARLRQAKGRVGKQPFTVHLASRGEAAAYLSNPSALVRRLSRKAWPGPLTLVCEEADPQKTAVARKCPPQQLAEIFGNGSVGLRCPDDAVAQRLIQKADVPVVASSANAAGAPAPFQLDQAVASFDDSIDFALDTGRTRFGAASTIVRVLGNRWELQRAGAIEERIVRRMATSLLLFVCTGNTCRSPLAAKLFEHKLAQRLGLSLAQLAEAGYGIESAGTGASRGLPASGGTIEELQRRGVPIRDHRSQPLTVELAQRAERIFVMSPEQMDLVLDLAPSARVSLLDPTGSIADPVGGGPELYRTTAIRIEAAVNARLEEFLDEDRNW